MNTAELLDKEAGPSAFLCQAAKDSSSPCTVHKVRNFDSWFKICQNHGVDVRYSHLMVVRGLQQLGCFLLAWLENSLHAYEFILKITPFALSCLWAQTHTNLH